jgi:hypothetical protein
VNLLATESQARLGDGDAYRRGLARVDVADNDHVDVGLVVLAVEGVSDVSKRC